MILTVLIGAIMLLGVVVWAEASSTAMFAPADLRETKKTVGVATDGAGRTAPKEERVIMLLFEREVQMVRTTYVTVKFCGVAVVILSMLGIIAIWVPPESKKLNESAEATPSQRAQLPSSPPSSTPEL